VDIIYAVTIYIIKLSLLISFHRLFWVYPLAVRFIYIGFVLVTLISIPHLGISIVQVVWCSGVSALTTTICKNRIVDTTNMIFGGLAVATDCFILAIPMCLVRTPHMRKGQKVGVFAVFAAGGVACVMSLIILLLK
jgi:hypothetical protein